MNNAEQNQAKALGLILPSHGKRRKWILLSVLVLLVAVAIGGYVARNGDAEMLYKTSPVARMDLALTVSATGSITPKDQVEVSSELSGIVEDVFVDYNDSVSAGQKLAQLDVSKLRAQLLQRQSSLRSAQAQVKTAMANLEEARLTYEYNQKVWQESQGKFPSQQSMDNARVTLAKANASVEQARASVDNAKAELEYVESDLLKSTIISPIDGIVLARAVEPGQTVASSFSAPTLFLLARDLRAMELIVAVDEADIGAIKVGQKATFSVDAYRGREFVAEIAQIRLANATTQAASTAGVVSYNTVLSVSNDDLVLLPSMTAVTDIAVAEAQDTLAIENAALRYRPNNGDVKTPQNRGVSSVLMPRMRGPRNKQAGVETGINDLMHARNATVWVLRGKQPVEVSIKIGISNGSHTQVISGELQEGDLVISDAVRVVK